MDFNGKVMLITGATGALGSAVARRFADTEARLVLSSRSLEELETLRDKLELSEERAFCVAGDVTQSEGADAVVEAAVAHFGALHGLINTVGSWFGGAPVHEISVVAWREALDINLNSAFMLSRAALPPMLEAGWGRVLHVSSRTAVSPRAEQVGYSVSKMGLIALTEVIAAEVEGSGITSNVIMLTILDTLANRKMMPDADTEDWVLPQDVAEMMHFLCTDAAASINGARIPIYGAV
jgi:NAD(P)-dependent dehydrogenase (short-subunit alcohol dehydrogenase family)